MLFSYSLFRKFLRSLDQLCFLPVDCNAFSFFQTFKRQYLDVKRFETMVIVFFTGKQVFFTDVLQSMLRNLGEVRKIA